MSQESGRQVTHSSLTHGGVGLGLAHQGHPHNLQQSLSPPPLPQELLKLKVLGDSA